MKLPPRPCGWLLGRLLRRTAWVRPPDFVIGTPTSPYLRRWWLIPRNRWFNLYVHEFLRSDDDRALHDHPWASVSLILSGHYVEHLPGGWKFRSRGAVVARGARVPHRVELLHDHVPVWTLFVTGPRVRDWGFHCPGGWRRWQDFVAATEQGNTTGPGCD